jgi:hypothetical protein
LISLSDEFLYPSRLGAAKIAVWVYGQGRKYHKNLLVTLMHFNLGKSEE